MAWDIIPENKKSSVGQRLSQGVGRGLELGSQIMQEYEQKKKQVQDQEKQEQLFQKENQFVEQLTGKDISGIRDPKMREKFFEQMIGAINKSQETGNKLTSNRAIVSDLEKKREMEPGSLSAYENDPAMAERISRPQKEPNKTQASQPIDPDQLSRIQEIRSTPKYEMSSPSKKYQMLTDNGVSKENAKAEADIYAEESKSSGEIVKAKQHEREFFHTESKKYDETLAEQGIAAEKKNRALESQLKIAHKLGKWDRVVSALAGQSKWGDLLKSSTAQEFDSYALPQMEGLRQILGGVLSDSDIRLIMQKVVTSSKTPEANEKIAKYLMSENNYVLDKKNIAEELKRNNGGYRPSNYESEISRIFNERYGNKIRREFDELQSLPDDPKKLNQVGRRVVPPGTPLGDNAIQMYFELANGDPIKATELAEEDGYDVPK